MVIDKTTKIILWVIGVAILVTGLIFLAIKLTKPSAPVPNPVNPNQPPAPDGLGNDFGDTLSNVSDWWDNLFGKCDNSRPCYTEKGNYKEKCCPDTYNPNVNICDPNKCDPNNKGYDECGNFSFKCG